MHLKCNKANQNMDLVLDCYFVVRIIGFKIHFLPIFLITASSNPEKNLAPSFIIDEKPGARGTCNAILTKLVSSDGYFLKVENNRTLYRTGKMK